MGWGFLMILFSRERGYFNISLPDMHWDQLNVLRYCRIEVTGSSVFKTKRSIRLKTCRRCLIFKRPLVWILNLHDLVLDHLEASAPGQ